MIPCLEICLFYVGREILLRISNGWKIALLPPGNQIDSSHPKMVAIACQTEPWLNMDKSSIFRKFGELGGVPHILTKIFEKMDFDLQCRLICTSKFGKWAIKEFGNEIETITVASNEQNLHGISIYHVNDQTGPIFIQSIDRNSNAYGRLRPGDEIMVVNGEKAYNKWYREVQILIESQKTCIITIRRHNSIYFKGDLSVSKELVTESFWRELRKPTILEVNIVKDGRGIGMIISSSPPSGDPATYSHFVTSILMGKPADGKLKIGDKILAVDGHKVDDKPNEGIVNLLRFSSSNIRLLIERRI